MRLLCWGAALGLISGGFSFPASAGELPPVKLGLGEDPERMINAYDLDGKRVIDVIRPDVACAWLNGTRGGGELSYFRHWNDKGRFREWSDAGYGFMLISWENYDGQNPSLGEPTLGDYHLSKRFISDLKEIANYLKGYKGGLYFALASEFSTYTACRYGVSCGDVLSHAMYSDRYTKITKDYYERLKANLIVAVDAVKNILPSAKTGLSFGGWLVNFDEPANMGGRSFIPVFDEVIEKTEMIFFQSMRGMMTGEGGDIGNPEQILANCRFFSKYKKPMGVSHYMPSSRRADVIADDIDRMIKHGWQKEVRMLGLEMFNFMEYGVLKKNEFDVLRKAIEMRAVFKKTE